MLLCWPPSTRTVPSESRVAVWFSRSENIGAPAVQEFEAGSKSSVRLVGGRPAAPPATSTLPLGSSVAVWNARALDIEPALLQEPLEGSKISAVASVVAAI